MAKPTIPAVQVTLARSDRAPFHSTDAVFPGHRIASTIQDVVVPYGPNALDARA